MTNDVIDIINEAKNNAVAIAPQIKSFLFIIAQNKRSDRRTYYSNKMTDENPLKKF